MYDLVNTAAVKYLYLSSIKMMYSHTEQCVCVFCVEYGLPTKTKIKCITAYAHVTRHLDLEEKLHICVLMWIHVGWYILPSNLQAWGAISSSCTVPGDQTQIWSQCHGQEHCLDTNANYSVVEGGGVLQATSVDMRRTCDTLHKLRFAVNALREFI